MVKAMITFPKILIALVNGPSVGKISSLLLNYILFAILDFQLQNISVYLLYYNQILLHTFDVVMGKKCNFLLFLEVNTK